MILDRYDICVQIHPITCSDGMYLHINLYTPVNHGGVAGVDVDGNTVARFGIPSTTDSIQTLQHTKIQ